MQKRIIWTVDEKGFASQLMQQQKDRSRAAGTIDAGDWIVLKEGSNKFVGYDSLEAKASILKYRKVKAKGKEAISICIRYYTFLCRKRRTGW